MTKICLKFHSNFPRANELHFRKLVLVGSADNKPTSFSESTENVTMKHIVNVKFSNSFVNIKARVAKFCVFDREFAFSIWVLGHY